MNSELNEERGINLLSNALISAFRDGQKVDRFSGLASEYYSPHYGMEVAPKLFRSLKANLVSPPVDIKTIDEAIESVRERAGISEGWIPTTAEERSLMKLAVDLSIVEDIISLRQATQQRKEGEGIKGGIAMSEELKPCPACNFDKIKQEKHQAKAPFEDRAWKYYQPIIYLNRLLGRYVVECQNCGLEMVLEKNEKESIEVYNSITRSTPSLPNPVSEDEAIESVREKAKLSEGWIPISKEERSLMKLAVELIESHLPSLTVSDEDATKEYGKILDEVLALPEFQMQEDDDGISLNRKTDKAHIETMRRFRKFLTGSAWQLAGYSMDGRRYEASNKVV